MSSGNFVQLFHYPSKTAFFYDDFLGDSLKEWWTLTGTVTVIDQQTGGICRIGSVAGSIITWNTIRSLIITKLASMESRLKLNSLATLHYMMEMWFDGNNRIGFVTWGNANWQVRCNSGGVSTTLDSGIACDLNYHICQIQTHTHGANHVHFFIDGVECANSPINTNVPTSYLEPRLYADTQTMDVDYIAISELR